LNIKRFGLEVPVVTLSIVAAYWHDLTILLDDVLNNEMASYILALPFLTAYMIYRRRNLVKAQLALETEERDNIIAKDIIGASLCLSALFLYIYGCFTFKIIEYHLVSLTIFIAGCVVLLTGIHNLRNLAFPLGFLLLLIIPYREEAYQAGAQLSTLTSTITYSILRALNHPVDLTSTYGAPAITIKTPTGEQVPLIIDVPCAGAYSLIGFLIFALFFAYISRGTPLRKAVWLLAGFLLIYAMNIARISLTLIISHLVGVEAAMGLFHLLSGSVLIFLASLIMILMGEKILKINVLKNKSEKEGTCPLCEENQRGNESFCTFCGRFFNSSIIRPAKVDLGKIVALAFVMALVVDLQVPAFALTQHNVMEMDLHDLAGSKETKEFLPVLEGYEPKFVYRDEWFERIAKQDASLLYVYYPQNSSYAPVFVSVEIADSYSKLHRWEICLYVVPSEEGRQIVNPIVTKDIQIMENPPLTGRLFTFKYVKSNQTVSVLYWYEKSAFKIGRSWANRYVKTSIIVYLDNFVKTGEIGSLSDYTKLESKLVSIAQNIIVYWEPVKAWSDFVVAFAGWGQSLSIITMIASSFVVAMLYLKRSREESRAAQSTYKQLTWHSAFSKEEKEIIKVIEILDQKGNSTAIELAKLYKEKTRKKIDLKKLGEIMRHAERYGLIKKEMVNLDGKPVIKWKTSITFNV